MIEKHIFRQILKDKLQYILNNYTLDQTTENIIAYYKIGLTEDKLMELDRLIHILVKDGILHGVEQMTHFIFKTIGSNEQPKT